LKIAASMPPSSDGRAENEGWSLGRTWQGGSPSELFRANVAIRAQNFRYAVRGSPRNYAVRLLVSLLVIDTANLTFGGRERIFLDAIESSGWLFHRSIL
jgi:hypothetical protein